MAAVQTLPDQRCDRCSPGSSACSLRCTFITAAQDNDDGDGGGRGGGGGGGGGDADVTM